MIQTRNVLTLIKENEATIEEAVSSYFRSKKNFKSIGLTVCFESLPLSDHSVLN